MVKVLVDYYFEYYRFTENQIVIIAQVKNPFISRHNGIAACSRKID